MPTSRVEPSSEVDAPVSRAELQEMVERMVAERLTQLSVANMKVAEKHPQEAPTTRRHESSRRGSLWAGAAHETLSEVDCYGRDNMCQPACGA